MKNRRIIALLLCVLLLVSAAPTAFADDGTPEIPEPAGRTEKPPMVQVRGTDTFLDDPLALGSNDFVISTGGETVYRPFTPTVSATYSFTSVSGYDTYGYLLDSEKNRITYNDDLNSNEFLIRYELTVGETYYLGVRYYSTEYTGTIPVTIEQHPLHTCGDDLLWSYDESSCTLTITGSGEMWNFAYYCRPWEAYTDKIKSVVLPDGLKSIGAYAFYCAYGLTEIDIPEGVETIGQEAFEYSNLNGIVLPKSLITLREYAFFSCPYLTSVTMQEGLETIGYFAFGCTLIESFRIPKTVKYIGSHPVYHCPELKPEAFTVDPANPYYTVDNGVLFWNTDEGTVLLHSYLYTKTNSMYTVSADGIYGNAFYENPYLKTVILSDGVKRLHSSAFYKSSALETIVIPTSLTVIEWGATLECAALTDVYYLGSEETRNSTLTISDYNDALLNAQWHYGEPFDGTIEWNPGDVQFKGATAYVIADGSAHTPRFTVKDAEGNVVDPANYDLRYAENAAPGTGYVIITFKDACKYVGIVKQFFKIYLPATTATTVANIKNGIKLTWSPVEGADGYVIYRRAWSTTTNGWTDFVRWNNTTATEWTDTAVYAGTRYQYGVKAYFNKRTDDITGKLLGGNVGDNFNLGMVGPLKTTVRITTRTLNSVTPGSKQLVAKWTGSANFTGYQLQIATNAAFTANKKTFTIGNPKTYQKTVTGLQSGKTYYVRVRSYHVFEGVTYYGEWSNVKNCKVK